MAKDAPQKEFLYRIQPVRPGMLVSGLTERESAVIDAHFQYLKSLTDQGVVILAARTLNTDETCFGIVILRASTEAAARQIMEADPAVREGVMRSALFPCNVALIETGKRPSGARPNDPKPEL